MTEKYLCQQINYAVQQAIISMTTNKFIVRVYSGVSSHLIESIPYSAPAEYYREFGLTKVFEKSYRADECKTEFFHDFGNGIIQWINPCAVDFVEG